MPSQPPRFRGAASARKAWAPTANLKATPRKRGRAGQRDRAQVLAEEPLCRQCLKEGRTSATQKVDHITPLAWGGSDDRSNKQGLCDPCHDKKSATERIVDAQARGQR